MEIEGLILNIIVFVSFAKLLIPVPKSYIKYLIAIKCYYSNFYEIFVFVSHIFYNVCVPYVILTCSVCYFDMFSMLFLTICMWCYVWHNLHQIYTKNLSTSGSLHCLSPILPTAAVIYMASLKIQPCMSKF